MAHKKYVAFVSDTNACRSIIAEAYMKRHGREYFESLSFAIKPNRVHYLVREVLESRGFNMNFYFSKAYEVIQNQPIDILILLNEDLREKLPTGNRKFEVIAWNFEDPTRKNLDENTMRTEIEKLCDQLEHQVQEFIRQNKMVAVSD